MRGQAAPATIPATSDATFTAAFAPPSPPMRTCSATSRCTPTHCARANTGASPPHITKFGSSNRADNALKP